MERKKVLFIHERYGRYAGAEQHLFVIAPKLHESYDLAFLYETATGMDEEAFNHLFSQTVQMPFHSASLSQIQEILQTLRPDLVYINKCLSVPMIQAIVQSDIPAIRMVHDHEVYCMRAYKYFPWSRRICHKKAGPCCILPCLAFLQRDRSQGSLGVRWVSYRQKQELIHWDQKLSAFFAITHYMIDELLLQGYDRQRIFLFPPVPVPIEQPFATPSREYNDPDPIILFVGQIVRGKGLDCLIKALPLIKTPYKLVVCGQGSHEQHCRELASSLGVADQIDFQGFVKNEQLPDYYTKATLVVVPSVWPEPMATIGLEVMRYGLPIVAFDSGGIKDWLRDGYNGYLIPWMDIPLMANRIEALLRDRELARQMGRHGQQLLSQQYSFDRYIDHLQIAFHALIEQGCIEPGILPQ